MTDTNEQASDQADGASGTGAQEESGQSIERRRALHEDRLDAIEQQVSAALSAGASSATILAALAEAAQELHGRIDELGARVEELGAARSFDYNGALHAAGVEYVGDPDGETIDRTLPGVEVHVYACGQCGATVADGAESCARCGAPIGVHGA